jgi:hypothetical protein
MRRSGAAGAVVLFRSVQLSNVGVERRAYVLECSIDSGDYAKAPQTCGKRNQGYQKKKFNHLLILFTKQILHRLRQHYGWALHLRLLNLAFFGPWLLLAASDRTGLSYTGVMSMRQVASFREFRFGVKAGQNESYELTCLFSRRRDGNLQSAE